MKICVTIFDDDGKQYTVTDEMLLKLVKGQSAKVSVKNPSKKDAELDEIISAVLKELGYSDCESNLKECRPSAKEAIKNYSRDELIAVAKYVKKNVDKKYAVPRTVFRKTDYWKSMMSTKQVNKGVW